LFKNTNNFYNLELIIIFENKSLFGQECEKIGKIFEKDLH